MSAAKQVWLLTFISSVLCILVMLSYQTTHQKQPTQNPVVGTNHYERNRVCEGAFDHPMDFSEGKTTHVTVELHDGCWSGVVSLPNWWFRGDDGFNAQSTGDQTGFWISYWFTNNNTPTGIAGPNHAQFFQNRGTSFRLQGHGKVIFFTHKAKCCT